ncbi:tumor necrosis factor ligand superfamily member 14-like, partial [Plectropomus leopardus]|uniref:tumor necrosis factor ligand superfamily member 14-like n=1 Tax=Plectropomus leopardus TaxID=160734 RepID=UPI001C4C7EEB
SSHEDTSQTSSKIIADQVITTPTRSPSLFDPPSKPLAHLTGGDDVQHGNEIMAWSKIADPPLYEMKYENKSLIIQKEGYYYIYSKVSFSHTGLFYHSINRDTQRYPGKSIPLLMSRTLERSSKMQSNSYLGGVFHLTKDDALFVKVSKTANIVKHKSFENVFGAYML